MSPRLGLGCLKCYFSWKTFLKKYPSCRYKGHAPQGVSQSQVQTEKTQGKLQALLTGDRANIWQIYLLWWISFNYFKVDPESSSISFKSQEHAFSYYFKYQKINSQSQSTSTSGWWRLPDYGDYPIGNSPYMSLSKSILTAGRSNILGYTEQAVQLFLWIYLKSVIVTSLPLDQPF